MANERKISALSRLFLFLVKQIKAIKTSFGQLSLSSLTSIMTFAVIGIALALPMGLYVLLKNVQTATSGLHHTAQISIYLDIGIHKDQIDNLQRLLRVDNDIAQVQYIPPDIGLKNFQKQFGFDKILSEFKENPLPGVIVIQPEANIRTSLQINQLVARLKRLPQINQVQSDRDWLERLNAIIMLGHHIIYALWILFMLAVLLIVGHTIRLTTQNHHDEIVVTKLLGATDRFIRRPFLYSGIIYGISGAIIAWLLVDSTLWWLQNSITRLSELYGSNFQPMGLDIKSTLFLLAGGAILGYLGSWLAVARHISMIEPH